MLKDCFGRMWSVEVRCHLFMRVLRRSMQGSVWAGQVDLSVVNGCSVCIMSVAFAVAAMEDDIRVSGRNFERKS